MTKINDCYPFKIKTISPVAIGNGLPDSSFAVYHFDGDNFYYLDFLKLKEIGFDNATLNSFVDNIEQQILNNKIDFVKLFEKTFNKPISILQIKQVKAFGLETGEIRIIREIVKTNNHPYITGSTIKGAIKNALLKNFIIEKKGVVLKKDNNVVDITNILKESISNKKKIKNITDAILIFENALFGDLKDKRGIHWSNTFRVADSSEIETWEVTQVRRLNINSGILQVPYLQEIIPKDIDLSSEIKVDSLSNYKICSVNNNFIRLNDLNQIKRVFKIVNDDSLQFIDYEMDRLKGNRGLDSQNLFEYYVKLKKQINEKPNKIFMRIGGGKTFFQNTIALALQKINNDLLSKYLELFNENMDNQNEDYPVSRAIITHKVEPLGWVEIEIDEEKCVKQNIKNHGIVNKLLKR